MDKRPSYSMRILSDPRKVAYQLEELMKEWYSWRDQVAEIKDHEYNPRTQLDVFADGEENMQLHRILQEKTLTFLDNNVEGHHFVYDGDGHHFDRVDLRLSIRVKHRISELEIIRASLQYTKVPDGFWLDKAKELATNMAKNPGKAVEMLAAALRSSL